MIQKLLIILSLAALGAVSKSYDGRVFNGEDAPLGLLPHQALIYVRSFLSTSLCGGSLISNNYVISAAHCFYPSLWYRVDVSMGVIDRQGSAEFTTRASRVVVHPSYRSTAFRDDIAVVRLRTAVTPSDNIQPAALPDRAGEDPTVYDGEDAIVSGWGQTSNSGDVSRYLQYQTVEVMGHQDCQDEMGQGIGDGHLCTNKVVFAGPCSGDSGGPLTVDGPTVIGVTSFITGQRLRDGSVACVNDNPAVYTNVAYYLDFIAENTGLQV